MQSRWFPDPDSEFGHFDVRLPFYHHDTVNAKQGQSGSQFPRDVLTGHDEPFDFHASLDVLAAVSDELFDVGLLEVLAERPQIPPRFVDDEAIAIETVPVNVKLKGSWFGSRVLEIGKHPPLVGIGATWFRSMLGDDTIRAGLAGIRVRKFGQHDRHEEPPFWIRHRPRRFLFAGVHVT